MKSICFILPHSVPGPTGGYKVVYEYANRLVADDYNVIIAYSGSIFWRKKSLRFKVSGVLRFLQHRIEGFSGRKWFPLDKRVKEVLPFSMNYRHMPKADVYIATSPYTAFYLNDYPIAIDSKFYFIQGREDWGLGIKAIVDDTYKMSLKKIVVSRWLQKMLSEHYNEESIFIPNGSDFNKFKLTKPIEKKDKFSISFLYSKQELKRCCDAIEALKKVHDKYPQLKVKAFGILPQPHNLPKWIEYYKQPNDEIHNNINNECGIYIATSTQEGWGLTVGEAMICGQAVCCTDNAGYKEMAIDDETALLSPVKDPDALAKNIIRLIEDEDLRINIATQGNQYIQKFTWDKSYLKFKETLGLD